MFSFKDVYHNNVHLVFDETFFSKQPGHVWVVCRYRSQWLLTDHARRGHEFPGGKIEVGESPVDAAVREVWEETGGIVEKIQFVGQYKVEGKTEVVIKNIYYANVEKLVEKDNYMETNGPILYDELPRKIEAVPEFSFIMKDEVLTHTIRYLQEQQIIV
ncbi:RNA deprotection pyrophosphohydrolase [Aliibacillus thermotolerans]|uniref:RNA deprotection pyrophosphohydrolase n=1 Tax=Aliibacillus thermotolerans TaxID=1834418 RepID=A0ABW0U7B8_9BACI|nr:nucleoside triphosphatase YtkD [Aliibacillus thermotolerans]MDA3129728.1 nucleoside triphosphatase YtkD [Aliibacillus thermotolerans]